MRIIRISLIRILLKQKNYFDCDKNENCGSVETNSAHSEIVATANMTPVPPPNAPNKSERTNIKPATAPPI